MKLGIFNACGGVGCCWASGREGDVEAGTASGTRDSVTGWAGTCSGGADWEKGKHERIAHDFRRLAMARPIRKGLTRAGEIPRAVIRLALLSSMTPVWPTTNACMRTLTHPKVPRFLLN